jgi:hypothetical protein
LLRQQQQVLHVHPTWLSEASADTAESASASTAEASSAGQQPGQTRHQQLVSLFGHAIVLNAKQPQTTGRWLCCRNLSSMHHQPLLMTHDGQRMHLCLRGKEGDSKVARLT